MGIKDLIIIGLVAYIVYDRYVREKNIELLRSDVDKLTKKAEELINKSNI